MSKYLTFSLTIVAFVVGIMAGFGLAKRSTPSVSMVSKLAVEMEKSETSDALYSDQQFLAEMIAHHEDAITMSEKVLKHTSRKEVKEMASDIIAVQSDEISKMKAWLMAWQ